MTDTNTKTEYSNDDSGALYQNDKKTKSTQPAMRGFMNLDGVDYWASAWKKVSKETKKSYMSIALQAKFVGTVKDFGSEEKLAEAQQAHSASVKDVYAELHPIVDVKSAKAPVMEGVIKVDEDNELKIVAWFRKMAGNKTFMSIKVDKQTSEAGNGDEIDESDCFFGFGGGEDTPQEVEKEEDFDEDEGVPFN